MEFALSDDQAAVLDAVRTILDRHAGADRARELGADSPRHDSDLLGALEDAGFCDLHGSDDAGPLEAALVVEEVARGAGIAAVGARALVVPAVVGQPLPGPVALTVDGHDGAVRYAPGAGCLLVAGPDEARVVDPADARIEVVPSRYCYPMGRLGDTSPPGRGLGPGSADRMRAWWRVALAIEAAGVMRAALDLTVRHLTDRHQFGHPIGSFQAVQHGMAEAAVAVDGARWLALEAAWNGAPPEAAAVAAAQAALAARRLFPALHQYSGAIGFTQEYDLFVWSMRLPALWLEAEWMGRPDTAAAVARWDPEAA